MEDLLDDLLEELGLGIPVEGVGVDAGDIACEEDGAFEEDDFPEEEGVFGIPEELAYFDDFFEDDGVGLAAARRGSTTWRLSLRSPFCTGRLGAGEALL